MLADKLPSREMILAELEFRATHRIESNGLIVAQIERARGDTNTKLPTGMARPKGW